MQLNGVDFDIPAGWESDVPRRGVLELYYCRTKEVATRVMAQVLMIGGCVLPCIHRHLHVRTHNSKPGDGAGGVGAHDVAVGAAG